MSDSPDDLQSLTAGHFLIGEALTSMPDYAVRENEQHLRVRWTAVAALRSEFWKRWSREYLCELQQHNKWTKKLKSIDQGPLVLTK